MSESPTIAQRAPYRVEVQAGESYFWCRCGKSTNQPLCDGSHKGTAFVPEKFEPSESGAVFFCGCKRTSKVPLCDGTHTSL